MNFIETIEKTYADGVEIIKKKNHDYSKGDNPFKNFELSSLQTGVPVELGILQRISDKVTRLGNLLDGTDPKVNDESIEDTLLDTINYLALLKAYRETRK